ncbi:hypothetical protein P7K49_027810, partial [Saguinus oedipus]
YTLHALAAVTSPEMCVPLTDPGMAGGTAAAEQWTRAALQREEPPHLRPSPVTPTEASDPAFNGTTLKVSAFINQNELSTCHLGPSESDSSSQLQFYASQLSPSIFFES